MAQECLGTSQQVVWQCVVGQLLSLEANCWHTVSRLTVYLDEISDNLLLHLLFFNFIRFWLCRCSWIVGKLNSAIVSRFFGLPPQRARGSGGEKWTLRIAFYFLREDKLTCAIQRWFRADIVADPFCRAWSRHTQFRVALKYRPILSVLKENKDFRHWKNSTLGRNGIIFFCHKLSNMCRLLSNQYLRCNQSQSTINICDPSTENCIVNLAALFAL